jgi:uncharacterized protein (TIGR02217 family)
MAGIVILTDIVAPNSLFEAGVGGRNTRRNVRGENTGGIINANAIWSNTKRSFTWGTVPHTIAVWQTLEGLFEVTWAGVYGFLLQDPKDPSLDHTAGKATLISAPAHTYQLVKRWTAIGSSPAATYDRKIKYLRASGFELKIAGVTKTLTADYTFDPLTGVVTIPADPAAGDVSWSGVPYVPVHFRDNEIEWELVVAGPETSRRVRGPRVVLDEVKQVA